MNINQYLEEYPDYLRGVRDASENTVKEYLHDVQRYLDYFNSHVSTDPEKFEITPKHLRNYVAYLRDVLLNDNTTVERRFHGISAFWQFLYLQYNYSTPVSLKICGIRNVIKRTPTQPISEDRYKLILEAIDRGLSKIK